VDDWMRMSEAPIKTGGSYSIFFKITEEKRREEREERREEKRREEKRKRREEKRKRREERESIRHSTL